ncbi:MAG: dihydropteroate synthase [Oceanococcaceae bacterium]
MAATGETQRRPDILGVLNVTPDSFSDGGRYLAPDAALAQAFALWDDGADIVDIGAESTRPGAPEVPLTEELRRLRPVFAGFAGVQRPWSIDTQKPEVMQAAVAAGATFINDVNALQGSGALAVAAELTASGAVDVVLMHRQGSARTMQQQPRYRDVVTEVVAFLRARCDACERAGIARERIVVDPGIGFGKTLAHNLALVRATADIRRHTGCRILVGVSRKSMFRDLLGLQAPADRVWPSAMTAAWCARQGADMLRVHDVRETVQALTLDVALAGPYAESDRVERAGMARFAGREQ